MTTRKGGGQPGNKNAEKHGFYSKLFSHGEKIRLTKSDASLEGEIKSTRVVGYRILEILTTGPLPPGGTKKLNDNALNTISTFFNAMTNLATLTRSFQIATGKYKPGETAILDALAELNAEDGIS
jgi:hypothetical protein